MTLRDPLLYALLASAAGTLVIYLDRRHRHRRHALDLWASRHGLRGERSPPLSELAFLEPLGLIPEIAAIERLWEGPPGLLLVLCRAGNRRQQQRYLLGVFDSHPELPAVRLLPVRAEDREAPNYLGFEPVPGSPLPEGYHIETFSPLPQPLLAELAAVLGQEEALFRIELRPGRLILATPFDDPERAEAMLALASRLNLKLARTHEI